jgi:hypothetical protein
MGKHYLKTTRISTNVSRVRRGSANHLLGQSILKEALFHPFPIWLWINTYKYRFYGDEHPFTSYFDVH